MGWRHQELQEEPQKVVCAIHEALGFFCIRGTRTSGSHVHSFFTDINIASALQQVDRFDTELASVKTIYIMINYYQTVFFHTTLFCFNHSKDELGASRCFYLYASIRAKTLRKIKAYSPKMATGAWERWNS
jgi:hypothetical protein